MNVRTYCLTYAGGWIIYNSRNYMHGLTTAALYRTIAIYNSRNYMHGLTVCHHKSRYGIYNSRNYMLGLTLEPETPSWVIYNSRNYMLGLTYIFKHYHLVSTIVEIICLD